MAGKRAFRLKKEYFIFAAALAGLAVLYRFIGCPFRLLFGVSCPGCGMVRAAMRCLRLDFAAAWRLHPLVFALPAVLVLLIVFRKNAKGTRAVLLAFAGALVAVYIMRIALNAAPETVYFRPESGWIPQAAKRLLSFFR